MDEIEDLKAEAAAAAERIKRTLRHPPDLKNHQKTKAVAEKVIGGKGYFGRNVATDFAGLLREWQQDVVLGEDPSDEYRKALEDPDGSFLAWLDYRCRHLYWLSRKADAWMSKRLDANEIIPMRGHWDKELMWAFVMMRHPTPRVAVLAARWFYSAVVDTVTALKDIVDEWEKRKTDDPYYGSLPEIGMEPERIFQERERLMLDREVVGNWRPCWFSVAERKYAEDLRKRDDETIETFAAHIGEQQRKQARRYVSSSMAAVFLRARTARLPDVVEEAVVSGLGPDSLVEAERQFAKMLYDQRVDEIFDPNGFGKLEFVKWLKTRPASTYVPPPLEAVQAERVKEVLSKRLFLSFVPESYDVLGGSEKAVVDEWLAKVAQQKLPAPETRAERSAEVTGVYAACGVAIDIEEEFNEVEHPMVVHFLWYLMKRRKDVVAARAAARQATQLEPKPLLTE